MRHAMVAAIGGVLLACSQVFAQGSPADVPGGRPISDPSHRPVPLAPIAPLRQPGWIEQGAMSAGAQLEPGSGTIPPEAQGQASPSAPEIRSYVANLTNAALSADGFRKAAGMLCDEDRHRLSKDVHDEDVRTYDELVQRFRDQWKARYGEEFDLVKQRTVMSEYYVLRGPQPDDPITVAGTVNANQGQRSVPVKPEGQSPSAARGTQERIATMVVPADPETQQPAMLLQFRNVPNGKLADWRLSTPQSLTSDRLRGNLTLRVKKLLDGQTKWPTDLREGYRLMSYHVLASMADQPMDRPRQQPGQPRTPARPDNPSLES